MRPIRLGGVDGINFRLGFFYGRGLGGRETPVREFYCTAALAAVSADSTQAHAFAPPYPKVPGMKHRILVSSPT